MRTTIQFLVCAFVASFAITTSAHEDSTTLGSGFGIGYQIQQYQQDFGISLTTTSPLVGSDIQLGLRLRGGMMFFELAQDSSTKRPRYFNAQLGVVGYSKALAEGIRLYGEGGAIMLFPSETFSSASSEIGAYALFGFEFYMSENLCYLLEVGGVGIGATADKIPLKPIYSNGLSLAAGVRYVF